MTALGGRRCCGLAHPEHVLRLGLAELLGDSVEGEGAAFLVAYDDFAVLTPALLLPIRLWLREILV